MGLYCWSYTGVQAGSLRSRLPWLLIVCIAACGGDESGTEPTDDNQAPTAVGSIPAQAVTAGEVVVPGSDIVFQ